MNVELALPAGFERVEAPPLALVARQVEPDPGGVHPNLTVAVEDARDAGLEAWAAASLARHAEELDGFHLLDREATEIDGEPALRTLAHHAAGGRALVLEQWRFARGDVACTVSATCGAIDWPGSAGILEAAAESVRLR
jgi:hypothetical protein